MLIDTGEVKIRIKPIQLLELSQCTKMSLSTDGMKISGNGNKCYKPLSHI
jgi:hypothetical protein